MRTLSSFADRDPSSGVRMVTATGLLRHQLERVLEAGVAFEHEESAVGITCVAAPILDPFDQPVGAISVTGPVHRFRAFRIVLLI